MTMRTRTTEVDGRRTIVAVFEKGDEPVDGLTALARAEGLGGASITGIGAFRRAVLGYFDRDRKEYDRIPVDEQVEVLSLLGDVAVGDDGPVVHLHVVVGGADGTARGGHLLEAEVWPTLEVVVTEVPSELRKSHDPETGLALIDLNRGG